MNEGTLLNTLEFYTCDDPIAWAEELLAMWADYKLETGEEGDLN
jgi:hypothetical protein